MTTSNYEQVIPSTTYEDKVVRVKRRPQGTRTAPKGRSSFRRLPGWDRSRKITITVKWSPGAESWWIVQARGVTARFPGFMYLDDVMARIFNEY